MFRIVIFKFDLRVTPSQALKSCSQKYFFSSEVIKNIDHLQKNILRADMELFTIRRLNNNKNSLYYVYLVLLSGDVNLNPGPTFPSNGSTHVTSNDIWRPFSNKGMHLLHLNVNSLLNKVDEVRHIASISNVSVFGLTETKLDNSVYDSEVSIDGYTLIRNDRNRHGGGVAFYIKNEICFNIKNIFSHEIENIFIDILLPKTKPFTVGVFYRPPNNIDFLKEITNDFLKLLPETNDLFILGDFNINILHNNKSILECNKNVICNIDDTTISSISKQYIDFCSTFALKQLIRYPTRVTSKSSTLIDHILTNAEDKISQSGIIDTGLSDHQLIFCTRKIVRQKFNMHKHISCRNFKNYRPDLFIKELSSLKFPNYESFNDVNAAYSDFSDKFLQTINKIAPIGEIRVKNNTEEWFDDEIHQAITSREKLLEKFKKSKNHLDEIQYKESRLFVQNLVKTKKRKFFENKLKQNIGNPKDLWKTLKTLGLPKKTVSSSSICLKIDDKYSFEAKENAECFKSFYSNLADDLLSKLPAKSKTYGDEYISSFYDNLNLTSDIFDFSNISEKEILNILNDIDTTKASGIDDIGGRFIKDGAELIALPIAQLCNLSIGSSSFPLICKKAKVIPIFKKGSKTEAKNYRPISLLPLISKIIERVIHDQTRSYLDRKKVLYKYQSGFRANFSTDSCLSYLHDLITKGFDAGLYTGMILIDLQKAFDTIDHEILLHKMSFFGFSDRVVNWFKCYLSNRTFQVKINEVYSGSGNVKCGVPQGSILGPLLFLLYVNDMARSVDSKLLLYADDSCLVFQNKDPEIIEQRLNQDFSNLCNWFIDNKLSIHLGEDKTKSILFASKRKLNKGNRLNIVCGSVEIKQHSKVSYLGCILDESLSGESMALNVINKINSKLKFLYRKNKFLTPDLKRMLCNALIQPHFDYACSAWYPQLTMNLKKKIQVAQNKCIRFCLELENTAHIGYKEYVKINWLNTSQRFIQCLCTSAFKYFQGKCPEYMNEFFQVAHQSNITTRSSCMKLFHPFRRTNMGQNNISFLAPKEWNKLPLELKLCNTINTFKHKLKAFFFSLSKSRETNYY